MRTPVALEKIYILHENEVKIIYNNYYLYTLHFRYILS